MCISKFLKAFFFISLSYFVFFSAACGKKKDDDAIATIGSSSGGSSTAVASALTSVSENIAPNSLDSSSTALAEDNPCANSDGFFDCQPILLKLYIKISSDIVNMVGQVVTNSKTFIDSKEAGSSGTEDITDTSSDIKKIVYNVTSANDFAFILHSDTGAFLHLDYDATGGTSIYNATFDVANSPDAEEGETNKVNISINYTDAKNFSATIKIVDMACSDDDVRAPNAIYITVDRADDVVTGKSMLLSERWLTSDGATCSLTPTDATRNFLYTDFSGNDTNSSASIYLIGSSVTSVDSFPDWEAADFCTNFSENCSNGYGFGDSNLISSYTNPFCATSTDATWGTDCTDVTTANYGDSSKWLLPSEMTALTVTMPTSL